MSLSAALQIGNSALTASQLAIQVAGNNLANAATPGYSRQLAYLSPMRSDDMGRVSIGTGVMVTDVRRQVDAAFQARLSAANSVEAAANQQQSILSQVESAMGDLGSNDLSSQLSTFFNSWSERANLQQSSAVVVQQGQALADFIKNLRGQLTDQQGQIDNQLGVQTQTANSLLDQIATLNQSISNSEAGGGHANTLRDQRDQVVTQLSQLMDISAVEQESGAVNILVGSTPVVMGSQNRGVELKRRSENGKAVVSVDVKADGQSLDVSSGSIGALLANRDSAISDTVKKLDGLTAQLIFEVNKLHSTGSNAAGYTTLTGSQSVASGDQTRPLDDPANATFSGLPFHATSGSFNIQVQSATGDTQTVRINVDLDGRTSSGAIGTSQDTSMEDIRAALNAVPGVSATITPDGKLKIDAAPGFTYSLSDDSSGVLAVLGVNSYFTGSSAADISVRDDLKSDPNGLAVGRQTADGFVENGTAMGITGLQDQALPTLGGLSIKQSWADTAQALGVQTDNAQTQAQAATTVRQALDAQQQSVSGVSVDEESMNLLTYQRQYQGAARFITTVDEMMQTLIGIV
jgi:flagellar hook-associated protein 1 FlgK